MLYPDRLVVEHSRTVYIDLPYPVTDKCSGCGVWRRCAHIQLAIVIAFLKLDCLPEISCLIELTPLAGREKIANVPFFSVVKYDVD